MSDSPENGVNSPSRADACRDEGGHCANEANHSVTTAAAAPLSPGKMDAETLGNKKDLAETVLSSYIKQREHSMNLEELPRKTSSESLTVASPSADKDVHVPASPGAEKANQANCWIGNATQKETSGWEALRRLQEDLDQYKAYLKTKADEEVRLVREQHETLKQQHESLKQDVKAMNEKHVAEKKQAQQNIEEANRQVEVIRKSAEEEVRKVHRELEDGARRQKALHEELQLLRLSFDVDEDRSSGGSRSQPVPNARPPQPVSGSSLMKRHDLTRRLSIQANSLVNLVGASATPDPDTPVTPNATKAWKKEPVPKTNDASDSLFGCCSSVERPPAGKSPTKSPKKAWGRKK